ncbi:uncharacterized protein LOC122519662 isoform X1 [Polistes fuscatus]|uniref:uncharacterized protein LOC122519662 isoform X1 n=2 Tax=Polistes fuscatus TaxID=30207 RepID=UPI001CA87DA6|nr:uncharacterized protein LOC122519662 isoform X1 [Polistes fuscatus]
MQNESINYGRIIPKCRPPIRNIKKCENKDINNDKNNNNIKKIPASSDTFVSERIIKMSNPNETTSTITDDDTSDYSDKDISDKDISKEDSNATENSSFDNSNLHNSRRRPKSPLRSNEKKKNNIEDHKNTGYSKLLYILPVLIVIFSISYPSLTSYFYPNNELTQTPKQNLDRTEMIEEFRKSVASIKSKFKSQTPFTWKALQSQVEDVINENSKISIVILLGNEINTIKCFARWFGNETSKVLSNDSCVLLNTRNIGNDHGEIITKWKADILKKKVVVIEDLLSMESESIKALHNLCDKENPLVSKSFYIITIMSNGYQELHKDKFVEDSLTAKFSKTIDLDILYPLIIRITDGPIIPIVSESNMRGKHNITECFFS